MSRLAGGWTSEQPPSRARYQSPQGKTCAMYTRPGRGQTPRANLRCARRPAPATVGRRNMAAPNSTPTSRLLLIDRRLAAFLAAAVAPRMRVDPPRGCICIPAQGPSPARN
jgi:hypothetical protein